MELNSVRSIGNTRNCENMNKPKILVVDDEPLNIELMEGFLSTEYEIMKATSGMEALTKVEKTPPDLILLDIMMPNMNGYTVCRELRRRNKTMAIPVLMITALKEKEDRMKAFESGADDFMNKPLDFGELRARMKSLLGVKTQDNYRLSLLSIIHLSGVFL